jgi:hypothetical protein
MLLQYHKQYTLSSILNLLLCLYVLNILVSPCINVSNILAIAFKKLLMAFAMKQ